MGLVERANVNSKELHLGEPSLSWMNWQSHVIML